MEAPTANWAGGPNDLKSNTGLTPHWKPKLIGETGSNSSSPIFLTGFGTAPRMAPRKGNVCGRPSKSRMISRKLAVAGSTGSFRTGAFMTKVIVWPVGVRAGTLENESGGKKKGVSTSGVSGCNVKDGIKRGGRMPNRVAPVVGVAGRGTRASVIDNCSSSKSLAIVFGPTIPSAFNWFDF